MFKLFYKPFIDTRYFTYYFTGKKLLNVKINFKTLQVQNIVSSLKDGGAVYILARDQMGELQSLNWYVC